MNIVYNKILYCRGMENIDIEELRLVFVKHKLHIGRVKKTEKEKIIVLRKNIV